MYQIRCKIVTESLFRIPYFGCSYKKFITGEKYKLSAQITNSGDTYFPDGTFNIRVKWPYLTVFWSFEIRNLGPNETQTETFGENGITDVLDNRAALFLVKGEDPNGNLIPIYDTEGSRKQVWDDDSEFPGFSHVHTIIPKDAEELYQLWGMLAAVAAIVAIAIKDVLVPFIQWLQSIIL